MSGADRDAKVHRLWATEYVPKLLHVYPQAFYHTDATIVGTPAALERLGRALISVAEAGAGAGGRVAMMPTDGEGYFVEIRAKDADAMEDERPYYSDAP